MDHPENWPYDDEEFERLLEPIGLALERAVDLFVASHQLMILDFVKETAIRNGCLVRSDDKLLIAI